MRRIIGLSVLLLSAWSVQAEVQGQEVTYQAGDTTLKGYLAYDDAITGQRPGILVVHEWWGHNEYARKRARLLAAMGYTALAVDMYGDGKLADHPKDAGQFAGEVSNNMEAATARFEAAMALLKQHSATNPAQISAIGYCFGGGIVLEMARRGVDLDLVASFHGSLGTGAAAAPGSVKAEVLVFNGAADPFVKPEQITAFQSEMESAGVNYRFASYPGAKHSFTNPDATAVGQRFDMPLAYDLEADHLSWLAFQQALEEMYGK
jgi:dienelactone hydrolase